jgi:predicted metal-dependent HD superfamily phosphohydrolase
MSDSTFEPTAAQLQFLEGAWSALVRSVGGQDEAGRAIYADLARRYGGPGRHYHTLGHLAEVLATVEELAEAGASAALRFGAWFHDAVYETRAADNEEQSAGLCEEAMDRLGAPPVMIVQARRLILATRRHEATEDDRDAQILLDADLGILGAPAARYASYARAIREEYSWAPEEDFRAGRRRVLESFLRRERIYFTQRMFAEREASARQNLRDEIYTLEHQAHAP